MSMMAVDWKPPREPAAITVCRYCGANPSHEIERCPRVETVEYFSDGSPRFISFWNPEKIDRPSVSADQNNNAEPIKPPINVGALTLHLAEQRCFWRGEEIQLTTGEFKTVLALASRPGTIRSRDFLLQDRIPHRDPTEFDARAQDSMVKRVRARFWAVDPNFSAIKTQYGAGYYWVQP